MISDPKGIDRPIQDMQQLFIANLWADIADSKKQFNARVFRNKKNDIIRPEVYSEIRNNYEEVKFDKRLSVLSWFDVATIPDSYENARIIHDVGIFFAVNLNDLYPSLSHRAIEESHLDVQKIILRKSPSIKIDLAPIIGEDAYGDYDTSNLKGLDMQPWHVFRFNCKFNYSLNC